MFLAQFLVEKKIFHARLGFNFFSRETWAGKEELHFLEIYKSNQAFSTIIISI